MAYEIQALFSKVLRGAILSLSFIIPE